MELLASVVHGLLSHWLVRKAEAWWGRHHRGGRRVSHPTEAPPVQATTSIPGVPEVAGVYAVLQALTAGNPLMGGWGYLTWTGSVYHEAADLNSMGGGDADLGAWVVTPLDGVVTFVAAWDGRSSGFGSHVAVLVDDPRAAVPCYVHVAHLARIDVTVGQRVLAGAPLGTCGKSGNQTYAHVHTAFWRDVPPGGWAFWQTGYSKDWVAQRTLDPGDWFWGSVAKAQGAHPPEVEMILSGAQSEAVQAHVWGPYWNADAAQFAIEASWRDEWRRGVWRGAPLSDEQLLPADPAADKPGGSFRVFEGGCAAWLPGQPVSWNG